MEEDKGTVCVTGGTGFIASWLIKRLLDDGYSVHTTVRADPGEMNPYIPNFFFFDGFYDGNKRDLSFLTSLQGAAEKLKIFNADLSDPDRFAAAIDGSKGVFHLATPLDFTAPKEVFIERAISGTLGVLKACLKSGSVKRVVCTSSQAAVIFNDRDAETMDESFWTDVDFVREKQHPNQQSYTISKTLPERAALEYGAQHGLEVVTVIPPFVAGPFICPKFPDSMRSVLALVLGEQHQYSFLLNTSMVHVDDLARAYIFLLEHPDAKGRYICSSGTISLQKMSELLRAKYPEFPIPTPESLSEIKGEKYPGLSSKKLSDTGFKFNYGVDEIFDDSIKCSKEKGYL